MQRSVWALLVRFSCDTEHLPVGVEAAGPVLNAKRVRTGVVADLHEVRPEVVAVAQVAAVGRAARRRGGVRFVGAAPDRASDTWRLWCRGQRVHTLFTN
jgi:hypothetical protein